jgi:hypothetical protein
VCSEEIIWIGNQGNDWVEGDYRISIISKSDRVEESDQIRSRCCVEGFIATRKDASGAGRSCRII